MQRFDGLKFLYLRKIQKKALESFDDLRRRVLRFVPHEYKNSILTLPNGSSMVMGGFRSEGEIDSYIGLQYDGIVTEDATTLTELKHNAIMGALRTSREDWRVRMYESANPGQVGHAWFRKMYYDPWKCGEETHTRFVHTKKGDNKFINPEYDEYLDGLTGWLRRAWRDGDFEISAGQFFTPWDEKVHVCPTSAIPPDWQVWCSMDYGFNHPTVVYLLALDRKGDIHVVEEHWERMWLPKQHAIAIKHMLERNGVPLSRVQTFEASPDAFAKRGEEEGSVAERYEKEGIHLTPANTDRISGAAELLARLGSPEAGISPSLHVFDRCVRLIGCIPEMLHDPHRPEDVLKVNMDADTGEGGDDPYESLRYGIMAATKRPDGTMPNFLSDYRGV